MEAKGLVTTMRMISERRFQTTEGATNMHTYQCAGCGSEFEASGPEGSVADAIHQCVICFDECCEACSTRVGKEHICQETECQQVAAQGKEAA
jgi:hypothetical protein